jgi:CBS domain-containing protein
METLRAIVEAKPQTTVLKAKVEDTVLVAVDEMCRHHVGALLVEQGDTPVGIVSERDLLTRVLLARRDPSTTRVGDVMTQQIVCVDIETEPREAMRIMTERRCRHLPVVAKGKVVAMVSIGDVVRWASLNQEYEIQMLHEYLEGKYPG